MSDAINSQKGTSQAAKIPAASAGASATTAPAAGATHSHSHDLLGKASKYWEDHQLNEKIDGFRLKSKKMMDDEGAKAENWGHCCCYYCY
ncbi:unnamed protein product [Ambrosiozyma monospora]|uniref:Unnamed protein product n=1 Tax=Ambrosiozyma monospora TaxID=43982 RepID=A0ACB5SRV9_AMBMO|nr:unnamed protein product [Ambrosiozyma monospora]